ncbi:uncharacterized protein LOC737910 [Pan troglodytes]|uniref:uncharacterized protein LOC737910 n=1 Tax=Pan troglodytes TaxID=9598 RepID=UPI0000E24D35|nr:uncharacterized protein LOC737910 [Pan troglodytes]
MPQPPPSRGHLHDFPSHPFFVFNPFCASPLCYCPAHPAPRNCLCMTVAYTGSRCLGARVCVCVCLYVCVHVCECARAPRRVRPALLCPPWARLERGVRPLGVVLCVRMRWEAAPTPGLCPGQRLTKQRAGAGFVFNCDKWGVFARSPFPTSPLPHILLQQ